jgi:competence protein ComEA
MMKQLRSCSAGLLAALLCLAANAGPVDVNTADAETLALELTGVGPSLAAAIVRDREENGRFDTPEALMRVKGIGEHIVEMNRENILTGEP